MSLTSNQSIAPFLGKKMSFIRGLDPLGLQNSSERTYSKLLQGLSNVTNRVRYYSFYSWLLHHYAKLDGSTDPKAQERFIRKAEYTLALASQFSKTSIGGVTGSLFASGQVKKNEDAFPLINGIYNAEGGTEGSYWKYQNGAFGQYYVGVLMDMGLIARREDNAWVFARTNRSDDFISGEELAEAFDETLSTSTREIFFRIIKDEKAIKEQLVQLMPDFNISIVPSNSKEEELLLKMILQKDTPAQLIETNTGFRNRTIQLLLNYASTNHDKFVDRDFVFDLYEKQGFENKIEDDTLRGWYYYQVNEFWQYACTAILNGSLAYLQEKHSPRNVPVAILVDELVSEMTDELKINKSTSLKDALTQNNLELLTIYKQNLKSEGIQRIVSGFQIIWRLYLENKDELERLEDFVYPDIANRDNKFHVLYYLRKLDGFLNTNLNQYLQDFLLTYVIYRHQFVAYKKIGGGAKTTQKFIIEDNAIRYIDNFNPFFTSPRIQNLLAYMRDLAVLNENNQLQQKGKDLLLQRVWS